MSNKKFLFFAMLALILGVMAFGVQQTMAAPYAMAVDDDDDDDDDDDSDNRVTILVDNDRVQCPNARFMSIQAAVNAAPPGATILVCPGTYPEQVRITKPVTIRGIRVRNENLIEVQPPTGVTNTTNVFGSPIAAIIVAEETRGVNLDNITVDGETARTGRVFGIFYRNSSGRIQNAVARNILGTRDGTSTGIFVQSGTPATPSGSSRTSRVEILNNSVHTYDKSGIIANEPGTFATIIGNAVSGLGPVSGFGGDETTAQNGIQIGFGARAVVEDNSVINNLFVNCTTEQNCEAAATNILIVASNGNKVARNTTGKSQVNIGLSFDAFFGTGPANNNLIEGNTIFDSDVFDGVSIVGGNNNTVRGNKIFNSDRASVSVFGDGTSASTGNRVIGNTFNEAPIGVFIGAGSSNTTVSDNRYFNIAQRVVRAPGASRTGQRSAGGSDAANGFSASR